MCTFCRRSPSEWSCIFNNCNFRFRRQESWSVICFNPDFCCERIRVSSCFLNKHFSWAQKPLNQSPLGRIFVHLAENRNQWKKASRQFFQVLVHDFSYWRFYFNNSRRIAQFYSTDISFFWTKSGTSTASHGARPSAIACAMPNLGILRCHSGLKWSVWIRRLKMLGAAKISPDRFCLLDTFWRFFLRAPGAWFRWQLAGRRLECRTRLGTRIAGARKGTSICPTISFLLWLTWFAVWVFFLLVGLELEPVVVALLVLLDVLNQSKIFFFDSRHPILRISRSRVRT